MKERPVKAIALLTIPEIEAVVDALDITLAHVLNGSEDAISCDDCADLQKQLALVVLNGDAIYVAQQKIARAWHAARCEAFDRAEEAKQPGWVRRLKGRLALFVERQ